MHESKSETSEISLADQFNYVLRLQEMIRLEVQPIRYSEWIEMDVELTDATFIVRGKHRMAEGQKRTHPFTVMQFVKSAFYRWKTTVVPFRVIFGIDSFDTKSGAMEYHVRWNRVPTMKTQEDQPDEW